jgi:eukaryotic-like serine/threonine-protein kinase
MADQHDSKMPVGTILVGKYKVSREIGRGGMAAVYEAEHLSLSKRIAIKILSAELTTSKVVSERFFREARAAASVKSPNIVDVYDSGRLEDGRPFIAMELLEGESLYDRMARIRIIEFEDTCRIIGDCARGLTKAHAAGIVHRDLKPENIFMVTGEDGAEVTKLLDFGLAKFYAQTDGDVKTQRLTREGAVFGTPAYMSPEQVKGQGSVDHRADLWALGCIAYECLTGRPVWNTEQGVAMTFAAIATAPLPVPSQVYPGIPSDFDAWFRKALERDASKRFQNAKELADSLLIALGQVSVGSGRGNEDTLSARDLKIASEIMASARVLPVASDQTGAFRAVEQVRVANPPSSKTAAAAPSPSAPAVVAPVAPQASQSFEDSLIRSPGQLGVNQNLGALSLLNANTQVPPKSSASPLRYGVMSVLLALGIGGVAYSWAVELRPQIQTKIVDWVPPKTTASAAKSAPEPTAGADVKWGSAFAEAQKLLAGGDLAGAQRKFKEASDLGAGSASKGMLEQVKAAADGPSTCKLGSMTRVRLGISGNAGRPAVLPLATGALVVWTDDHEQAKHAHVYGARIDKAGILTSPVRDLTPEANDVDRPVPIKAGDQTALFYWERSGKDAGARARILDAEGRIESGVAGESRLIAGSPGGKSKLAWPSYAAIPGGFYVVWEDERDGNDDLFGRRLGIDLAPQTPEVRLTDYRAQRGRPVSVKLPVVAVGANSLMIAYRLDRDNNRSVMRARIALTAPELQKGLDEKAESVVAPDRELGETKSLADDRVDAPSIACGKEGCFVAWHREPNGAYLARLEPQQGRHVWHKQIVSGAGGRPSLSVSESGAVSVVFYEQGKVKIAPVTRDGIGPRSAFGKISGDQPRASLAPGRTDGEWYVSWLETEGGKGEPYVARLSCSQ